MNYVPGRYIYSKVYNMSDHNCVKVKNTSFSCFYDMEVNLCKVSFSVTSCLNLKFKAHTVNIVKWYYDATNCFDKLYGLTVCVERETERGRERQTERDRDRERDRKRETERDLILKICHVYHWIWLVYHWIKWYTSHHVSIFYIHDKIIMYYCSVP